MEVILLEKVSKLGNLGDMVNVRPGYARNFLIPNKKAVRATTANREQFEHRRAEIEAAAKQRHTQAEKLSATLGGLTVVHMTQAGEKGQLFGSVRPKDITDGLAALGHKVDRQAVVIPQVIKTIGLFDVELHLHADVVCRITVNVARSLDEAAQQLANPEKFRGGLQMDASGNIVTATEEVAENTFKGKPRRARKPRAESAEGETPAAEEAAAEAPQAE